MLNINKNFWENYYLNNNDDIIKESTFANYILNNYIIKNNIKSLIDLGAGNCRDTIFFSKNGINVKAVDYNGILNYKSNNCELIKENAKDFLIKFKNDDINIIYMRWFLHAMPYDQAEEIFKLSIDKISTNSLICIELRSLNDIDLINNSTYDKNDKSYMTTHKRWLYNKEIFLKWQEKFSCSIIEYSEGNFSENNNTETKNPLLIRVIFKK